MKTKKGRSRLQWLAHGALFAVGLVIVVVCVALIVLQTDWFQNQIRERIIAVAEEASGGRVEIGRFRYNWRAMTAEVTAFTLHGKESPSAPPFLRAESVQIGLRIISIFKQKVDIASLIVKNPQVSVTVASDGSTNIPSPKVPRSRLPLTRQLLDLKVRHFELQHGWAEYNSRRIPLEAQGSSLHASLRYESSGPCYVGEISSSRVLASTGAGKTPTAFDFAAKVALEQDALHIREATFAADHAQMTLHGSITSFASPQGVFDIAGSAPVNDLRKIFRFPLNSPGDLSFEGHGTVQGGPLQYKLEGKLTGRGLAYAYKNLAIRDVGLTSQLEITNSGINMPALEFSSRDGQFRGSARLPTFKRLAVEGELRNVSLKALAQASGQSTGQLAGTASGPLVLRAVVRPDGLQDISVESRVQLTAGVGPVPMEGAITVNYDQRAGKIQLPDAQVHFGSTDIIASGTLGETLGVQVTSKNLSDATAVLPLAGVNLQRPLPVALEGSSMRFDGSVRGPLANPRITGKLDSGRIKVDGHHFDHLTGTFDLARSAIQFHAFTLQQGKMRVEGQGSLNLRDWKLQSNSPVSAIATVSEADLHTLTVENGLDVPLTGMLAAELRVSGSVDSPLVTGNVDFHNVNAYGEHADAARAAVTYAGTGVEVENGDIRTGSARISVSGSYNHVANNWKDGALRLEMSSTGLTLAEIKHVQNFRSGLGGRLDLQASGSANLVHGVVDLTSLNAQLHLRNAVVDGRSYGDLELTASTHLPVLSLSARVNLNGVRLQGDGEWRMEGDYPGQAHVEIPRIQFATLHELAPGEHLRKELPFDGFIQGEATIRGPLNNPSAMKAEVNLSSVQVNANPSVRASSKTPLSDLVLRNDQPVQLEANTNSIDIRRASFTAKDTTLDASGHLALDSKNPWNLAVKGHINLSILQIFNPDLLGTGTSVVNVAVRGPLMEPEVDGRLELMNASLFLRDLPNGIDQANGLILFDRNRATVDNLKAVTGGGAVTFQRGSFVGFRGTALLYGLRADLSNVRYRSDQGLSVTADATLSLTGTSENSLLSGSVKVIRAAFSPRADVGNLLAATARPTATTTQNEYLAGIRLDVQLTTASRLELESSLTRSIQADANLRLRGTPEEPVVLGNISINSGQIEFFGNKYTINRGEINFYNAAKIEPIIDMDLETKVRGISVDISFAGPLDKLNFSYRSDPPLQASDIIALLAVGRTPSSTGAVTPAPLNGNTNYVVTGSNSLLQQAIEPEGSRLQRFFGVSHIKLDPQPTDVTIMPQARLTLEQQISADITLTYITNLEVTNQQVVRVEWDLNRKWSVVALRDENGAFSVDFQYRKRFK